MTEHCLITLRFFGREATAAMGEAYESALKELHDTGQPEIVHDVIVSELSPRQKLASAIQFVCGKPRFVGLEIGTRSPNQRYATTPVPQRRGQINLRAPAAPRP